MDHLVAVAVWGLLLFPSPYWAWTEQQPHTSTLLLPPARAEAQGFDGCSSGAVLREEMSVDKGKGRSWGRKISGRASLRPLSVQKECF